MASPAKVKLMAARLAAAESRPYLATALWALVPIETKWVGTEEIDTLAVDQHWRLYFNPDFVAVLTLKQLSGVLQHEVWHLLRDHVDRAKRMGVTYEKRELWNDAGDAEINDDMVREGTELPNPTLPDHFGLPRGLLAEEYYNRICGGPGSGGGDAALGNGVASRSQSPSSSSSQTGGGGDGGPEKGTPVLGPPGRGPGSGRCGSCAHGHREPWELPAVAGKVPSISNTEAGLIRRDVARQLREYAKSRGTAPDGMRRWAEEILQPPKVDWRKLLAGAVRASLSHTAGCVDYSYSRPSRRQAASQNGIILPAMRRPLPTVLVVVDTSGSMSAEDLGLAINEMRGVLRTTGLGRTRFMACDAATGPCQQLRSAKDAEMIGGGGTDMRVAVAAAERLRPRPDTVIILTDGHTPYPEGKPRGMNVIVALVGEDHNEEDVPTWARKVVVD